MRKQFDKRGFTLIELIVIMVILGIFVAWFVPSFLNTRENSNLKRDTAKFDSVCSEIKSALGDAEVQQYLDNNGRDDSGAYYPIKITCQIDSKGKVDFGAGAYQSGDMTSVFSATMLGNEVLPVVDRYYEVQYRDYWGKTITFQAMPKTFNTTQKCSYTIGG